MTESTSEAAQPIQGKIHWSRKLTNLVPAFVATLVAFSGLTQIFPFVRRVFQGEHLEWFSQESWRDVIIAIGLLDLPKVFIGMSLLLMAIGLAMRARLAWVFTLILLVPTIAISAYAHQGVVTARVIVDLVLLYALVRYWSMFNRSSLAAGSLFALASLVSLVWYAILGSLYLGHEFNPHIKDLATAAYFSVVAMSTVGFGDIVPVTSTARMFVVSIIVLGLTVFATSLGAIVGPFVSGTLRQILKHKARTSMRKDHVILCGATPLAITLYNSLVQRGESVTVVLKPGTPHEYPPTADILWGEASSGDILIEAGVMDATFVLALREDDPDNAFIVLAVKSFPECKAKTVAVVNASQNLEKIRRVNPDWVFSPQLLGAELLARSMTGEKYDSSLVSELFFAKPIAPGSD